MNIKFKDVLIGENFTYLNKTYVKLSTKTAKLKQPTIFDGCEQVSITEEEELTREKLGEFISLFTPESDED